MTTLKYAFALEGQSHFMKEAIEAQGELIEPFYETPDWEYAKEYFQTIPALKMNHKITACAGPEIVGVVCGFIGGCFAEKIFDEVYERTLKRPVGKMMDSIFRRIDFSDGMLLEYRDVIYLDDLDLTVVVRAIVDKTCASNVDSLLANAHLMASKYINEHGKRAPIHCHRIFLGKHELTSEFFSSLEHIKADDNAKVKAIRRF